MARGPESGIELRAEDFGNPAFFGEKVGIGGADECWNAICGGKAKYPMANFPSVRRAPIAMHRVAYAITNGSVPARKVVCHRCDNPRCCNPNHLFLGTQADNVNDSVAKGRRRGAGFHIDLYCKRGHKKPYYGNCTTCAAFIRAERINRTRAKREQRLRAAGSMLPPTRDGLVAAVGEHRAGIAIERLGLYGSPVATLAEVGGRYGITRERVRQITNRVIELAGRLAQRGSTYSEG